VVCATIALGIALAVVLQPPTGAEDVRSPRRDASASAPVASLRRVGHTAELEISRMSEPPFGEVYELWLDRPGAPPRPTDALFSATSAGRAAVQIPGSLRGLRSVLVTAEPLGGSSSPTSAPILWVAIPG
jgi:hypothetical protein